MSNQALPVVAIVGRPNVGKSTLFNTIIGQRKAIVSEFSGTTRDSVTEKVQSESYTYLLVDTAGLTDDKGDSLEHEIQAQALLAIQHADVVLFLIDGKKELTYDDHDVVNILRKGKTPVIFCVNKLDDGQAEKTWEYTSLGLGMPLALSAKNYVGIYELQDEIEAALKKQNCPVTADRAVTAEEEVESTTIKVAFVGRPNVGKSSLFNQLIRQDRSVVSDVSGTTRDTIDTNLFWDEASNTVLFDEIKQKKEYPAARTITLIDTAGLRRPGRFSGKKQGKVADNQIEFWSTVRTRDAIERADICVLLIDALDGVTHQDLIIAGKILESGNGLIVGVNKFDLVKEKSKGDAKGESDERELDEVTMWGEGMDTIKERYLLYLSRKMKFLSWAPALFFSAKTGKGVGDVFKSAVGIFAERTKRIPTSALNQVLPEIMHGHVAPSVGTKHGKMKFISQVAIHPPKFMIHVNNIQAFHSTYRRYVENRLREKYGFFGTPIQLEFKDAMGDRNERKHKKS